MAQRELDSVREALAGVFESSPLVRAARGIETVGEYATEGIEKVRNYFGKKKKKEATDIELPKDSRYAPRFHSFIRKTETANPRITHEVKLRPVK